MADLEEIMAGGGGSAPSSDQQTTHEQQTPAADQNQGQPQGQAVALQEGDDDPALSGVRQALDAERGKSRKYKETVESFEKKFDGLQAQFHGFMQAMQPLLQQQRPQPQQEQPAPVDIFENPDAFFDARLSKAVDPLQSEVLQTRETYSRRLAEIQHTPEKVNEAYEALDAAIKRGELDGKTVVTNLRKSMDPFGDIMGWYQNRPEAQRERLRAEFMAEFGIQPGQTPQAKTQQQQQPQAQTQSMPTSFAGARSSGPRTNPQWSGPKPLSELMGR